MRLFRGTKEFLDRAVSADYESGYQDVVPWWESIFDPKVSSARAEVYASNERTVTLTPWDYGAERTEMTTSHITFEVTNKRYQAMLSIEVDDLEDDGYGLYEDDIRMLGQSAGQWKDILAADFLKDGTSIVGRDGANFFSTTHPTRAGDGSGANQANLFTSTPLTFDNLNSVRSSMRGLLAPNGRRYNEFGSKLVLVVPPELELVAMQIVNGSSVVRSATQSGTGALFGSVDNPMLQWSLSIVVANDLTESTAWYLADVSGVKPCKMQIRKEPELRTFGPQDSATLAAADKFLYSVKARGAAFGSRWQKIARAVA